MTLWLGWIRLLEWLTELKNHHLLTRLLMFYTRTLKATHQQPGEETHRTRSDRGAWGPAQGSLAGPRLRSSLKQGTKMLSCGALMEASLHNHDFFQDSFCLFFDLDHFKSLY